LNHSQAGKILPKIAIITHDLSISGGAASMTRFLHGVLKTEKRYDVQVISLATSMSDEASVLFRRPGTWVRGPRAVRRYCDDIAYLHAGAIGAEVEFQRYRPRKHLRNILREYDFLFYAIGTPSWAATARGVGVPFGMWVASTVRDDRMSRLHAATGWSRWARTAITSLVETAERQALRRSEFVLTISEYTKGLLRTFETRSEPTVAPCGVDIDLFVPCRAAKPGYLLSVGRLSDPRKNVRMLLNAYRILRRRCSDAPDLLLIGNPPEDEVLEEVRQWGIREHVAVLGPRRGKELAELYRNAGCFALSSDQEGLAIVVIEAMASGLPVVCTRCGGPEMLVRDGVTGFLSGVGDAEAFARNLEAVVIQSKMREQFGSTARRIAEQEYSLSVAGKPFLAAVHEHLFARRLAEESTRTAP
jgi:glycosyltransferase involved in cell wall biosynthesis